MAVGDGNERLDIISHMERMPHALEEILGHVDRTTLMETVAVSTTWKRLITATTVWKCCEQWRRNVIEKPTWKILGASMEHFRPKLLDRIMNESASSYVEACQYVKENLRQILQLNLNNRVRDPLKVTFASLKTKVDGVFRVNEKCVYTVGWASVEIFNRWTGRIVGVLEEVRLGRNSWATVEDMQLNERVLAVKFERHNLDGDYEIEVYDLENLRRIQIVSCQTTALNDHILTTSFCLGANVLITYEWYRDLQSLIIRVHRWNPVSAQFDIGPQDQHRIQEFSTIDQFTHSKIYVDTNYLIVDLKNDTARLIRVFNLKTMQQVGERQFTDNPHIKKEYHDGGIVVQTCTANGQLCIAHWDVDKDTVEPIADHPIQFEYSFAMCYHPYQVVIENMTNQPQCFLVKQRRPSSNSSTNCTSLSIPSKFTFPMPDPIMTVFRECFISRQDGIFLYFDGVQLLYRTWHSWSPDQTIHIENMIG